MLNTKHLPKLMPGLEDSSVEFYVYNNEVKCFTDGVRYSFENFPQRVIDIVQQDLLSNSEALKSLAKWENLTESDYLRQYIYCRFGGVDSDPDIDTEGNIHHAEYFECGLRGQCKYEGKLCCSIKVDHGFLSKSEMEVLKRVALPYKLIADELNISPETVNTHMQNIRIKTGLSTSVELAIYATKKGII
jgi:DNA-binding CsgD family transcriptional regulator